MSFLIISDIHGSDDSLKKLTQEMQKVDKIIILGDYLNYSNDENKELITILNNLKEKIIGIKGNCDTEYTKSLLNFKLHNYYLLEIDGLTLFLTHGNIDYSYLIDESYIKVSGHTHVYLLNENQINPGSIAYPRLNKNKTYIIYENNTFELFDLDTKEKIKKLVIERKK